jgi:uncharacterized membrane protein YdbT with pleckstrin-like domain
MVLLIGFITIIVRIITNISTELEFTNKRILGETGFLDTTKMDIQLNRIEDITVHFDTLGGFFNYGDIVVSTAADDYSFTAISKPDTFKSELIAQIELYNKQ